MTDIVESVIQMPIGIFNKKMPNLNNSRIILGPSPGLMDSINRTDEVLFNHYKNLKSLDWDEAEFRYSLCLPEFARGDEDAGIMIDTIAWQWETDTVVARILMKVIGSFVTDTDATIGYSRIIDNECLTPDHEVLTSEGWKRIDEIELTDKVAQWDYHTREVSFTEPQDIIRKQYTGPMYHFHDRVRNISQITTPKHRLPLVYPYWNSSNGEWKYAEDIKFHGGNALPTSGFIGNGKHMSAQERLYIAVQADGALCSDKYTGASTGRKHYRFGFNKERKIARLMSLCQQAGWDVVELNTKKATPGSTRHFIVHVPIEEYNPLAKSFEWIKLDEISFQWATDFIEEIQYWDGNTTESGNARYISTNKECIDIASTIAHLVGMRGHITTIPERFGVTMPNGSISDTKQCYQIYFSDRPYVTGNSISKDVIDYEGEVFCLTVPTGYFLVRHNGAISVTGNCLHALTYSEMARTAFPDPNLVMRQVLENEAAHARLIEPALIFEEARIAACKYELGMITKEEALPIAVLFFAALPTLERSQFMPSFAVTFAYGEVGRFRPIANGVQKICQDEFEVHIPFNKAVFLRCISTPEGQRAFEMVRPRIIKLLNAINRSEREWVTKLFTGRRGVAGLTKETLSAYNDYSATDMAQFFGIESEVSFDIVKDDPLPYMKNWIVISKTQKSPQEEDPNQYKLNVVERDDHGVIFDTSFL